MKIATYTKLDGTTFVVECDPQAPCVVCKDPVVEMSRKHQLILGNQGLVYKAASKFYHLVVPGLPWDREDIQGWGQIGLIKAAEMWTPHHKKSFAGFATMHIRGAIRHALRDACKERHMAFGRPDRPHLGRVDLRIYLIENFDSSLFWVERACA